jgi:3-oxoacyl-[acyl-carrier protein] reductase
VKLHGRIAIVTGAGSGIGRAIASGFCANGASVVGVDIRREAAEETGRLIDDPTRFLPLGADVSLQSDVERVVAESAQRFGPVDVLCNNAGVFDGYTPAHEMTNELWNRVIGVNLTGAFLFSRAVLPTMIEQGRGVIVNVASAAALVAGGGGAAYTTSKHALLGFTKQLAFDYGKYGIRANTICPGAVRTGMTDHLVDGATNPRAEAAIASTPAGRWGEPVEIADLAVFLASDNARFIHGAALAIDGGWTVS